MTACLIVAFASFLPLSVVSLALAQSPAKTPSRTSPPAVGSVESGHHRSLFVEAGIPPEIVTRKVQAAFRQLFHGDPRTQAVYFPAGKNKNGEMAYILDVLHDDVRSEGMSYGMMIAVQLDKKSEFDALWNWAKTHMYHERVDHPAQGYFAWSMKRDGSPNDEMPAPDGEEYFATALYFAAGRWGNGTGIYDYKGQADRLLRDMRHRPIIEGRTVSGIQKAGNLFHPEHAMVRFTPDLPNRDHTDPSYHLPAFYELWALWGPAEDRAFWEKAADASRDFFQKAAHPSTGLTPEYANFDGTPWAAPWNEGSVHFQFDAWRSAMNWSMDWSWWAKDTRQPELSNRLQAFFESRGIKSYGNQFTLEGRQFGNTHSTGLVAMNAVAGLAATHPRAREFVQALWDTPVPSGQERYYDGMLYLLGMLHCSGDFRVWAPQNNVGPDPSDSSAGTEPPSQSKDNSK